MTETEVKEEEVKSFALDDKQLEAVKLCTDVSVKNRIAAVTGPAGTGKTTIMRTVYDTLEANGYSVGLCSPTGKAAKRIREATGLNATTIHKLLEYPHPGERDPKTGKVLITTEPKRHRYNPLMQDVILVDEGAMVNHELYRNLIDALKNGACIRFFGDINQLAPIEKDERLAKGPSPFSEMLTRYRSVTLDVLHRQGEGSGIVTNGKLITQGRLPRRTSDFDYQISDKPIDVLSSYLDTDHDITRWTRNENQIITPTNIGWIGTYQLNTFLQSKFQRDKKSSDFLSIPRRKWEERTPIQLTVGDKVIWIENNYDLNVFNGETGNVVEISDEHEIVIDFGDRSVVIPPSIETVNKYGKVITYDPRTLIDLAYAITTHKSQGSEYQDVIYLMHSSRPFALNRKNFYTGVTRARSSVFVITDQRALTLSMRAQS